MPVQKTIIGDYGNAGQVTLDFDETNQKHVVHEQVYTEPLIQQVKDLREVNQQVGARVGSQNHMTHVAEVPMTVYNQSIREKWTELDWKRWVNDPSNAALRVTKGRF